MLTLPSTFVAPLLRVMRANRTFVTTRGAERRVRERALRPLAYGPPQRLRPDVKVSVDLEGDWPIYELSPNAGPRSGNVVYVHGGGWVNEIASQHWHLAAQIAVEAATTVTLPIYPLVPRGTAGPVRDGILQLVHEGLRHFGSVRLAGDSAGGQIALSTALALRDAGIALPNTVLISPALDLTWSNPRIPAVQPSDPWLATPGGKVLADLWRGDLPLTDPAVSPLFGSLEGLGPITIFTGTRDVLNPDAHLLVELAREAGVAVDLHEVEGQVHVYPLLPTKVGAAARRTIVAALRG